MISINSRESISHLSLHPKDTGSRRKNFDLIRQTSHIFKPPYIHIDIYI